MKAAVTPSRRILELLFGFSRVSEDGESCNLAPQDKVVRDRPLSYEAASMEPLLFFFLLSKTFETSRNLTEPLYFRGTGPCKSRRSEVSRKTAGSRLASQKSLRIGTKRGHGRPPAGHEVTYPWLQGFLRSLSFVSLLLGLAASSHSQGPAPLHV